MLSAQLHQAFSPYPSPCASPPAHHVNGQESTLPALEQAGQRECRNLEGGECPTSVMVLLGKGTSAIGLRSFFRPCLKLGLHRKSRTEGGSGSAHSRHLPDAKTDARVRHAPQAWSRRRPGRALTH
eukprot:scaffold24769_cov101-Isochrysis_galbana.AAC.1